MPTISFATFADLSDTEVLALYESVGWTAYTKEPATLWRALENSACVVTARDSGGALIGLARAVSDDEPGQRTFYEAQGFTEGADFTSGPLRMFAQIR